MWEDPSVAKMSRDERLLFIGMISVADDEGRLNAAPSRLLGEIFPNDNGEVTAKRVKQWRDAICEKNPNVLLYTVDDVEYIQLLRWEEYNRPSHASASKLPAPKTSMLDTETLSIVRKNSPGSSPEVHRKSSGKDHR